MFFFVAGSRRYVLYKSRGYKKLISDDKAIGAYQDSGWEEAAEVHNLGKVHEAY